MKYAKIMATGAHNGRPDRKLQIIFLCPFSFSKERLFNNIRIKLAGRRDIFFANNIDAECLYLIFQKWIKLLNHIKFLEPLCKFLYQIYWERICHAKL